METTIIYLRVSTDEQNPQNQLRDCSTLLRDEEPHTILEEHGSAWADKDRPKFESIRKAIKAGKVKRLICWDLDRLYRNRKALMAFFKLCKIHKCIVLSHRQQWLNKIAQMPQPFDEMMSDLMIQMMGWLAEEESNKKSQRVKASFKNHKGKKWGRPSVHTNKKKIVWDLRDQGKSIRAISREVGLSVGKVSEICSEKVTSNTP